MCQALFQILRPSCEQDTQISLLSRGKSDNAPEQEINTRSDGDKCYEGKTGWGREQGVWGGGGHGGWVIF